MKKKQEKFLADLSSMNGSLEMRDIFFSFCMGVHGRLGQKSILLALNVDEDILRFLWNTLIQSHVDDFSNLFNNLLI